MTDDSMSWFPTVVVTLMVLVPAAAGIAMLVAAARRTARSRRIVESGRPATAVVVDNQQQSWSDGRLTFRPVVTYVTDSGQEVRTVLADLSSHSSHLAGAEYPIAYDPAKPHEAVATGQSAGPKVLFVVVALMFLAFAVVALVLGTSVLDIFNGEGPDDTFFDNGFFGDDSGDGSGDGVPEFSPGG